ncbi:hypothetical protein HXX76_011516 [Chlamydomonas incerta]|uniref:Uncharacterized protein n=1 Tax=Chlamydomonas incerta TaxID=51695 RepID=A0A835VXL8_CHLIN|nr:hypothetical protein HXX76_011516 [Chlamydomonas incerta]|eukprot:KAG2428816.1 hypothetical protein HXX76_011516 [Chlamydomonas incerta]
MGFWNSFNNWYRTFWEESGRRPGVHEVKRWYEDCADACWGPIKPSWEETRTHSKCLRSLEQVRSYFKAYRAAKKEGVEGSCRSEATRSCGGFSQQPSLRARSMSAISAQDDDPPFVMRAPKVRRPSDSETADGSFFSFATATGACFPTASETTTTTTTNSPASKYSSRTQELGGGGAGGRAVRSSSFTGHSMSLASGLQGGHTRTISTGGGSSGAGIGTGVRAAVRMVFGEDSEGRALPILLQRAPGESLPIPVSANNAAAWMLPPPAPPPSRMPSPTPTSAPDGCGLGAGKALPPLPPLPSLPPVGGSSGPCSGGPSFPGAAAPLPAPHHMSPYFYGQAPAAVGAGLISPAGQLEPHASWPPAYPPSSDRPPLPPTHSVYPHYPGMHNSPYYPPPPAAASNTASSSVPGSLASGTGLRPSASAPTMLPSIPFPSSQSLPPLPRIVDMQAAQQRSADSAAAAAAAAAAVAAAAASEPGATKQQHQGQPSSTAPGAGPAEAGAAQGAPSVPPAGGSLSAPGPSQPGQQHPAAHGAYPYPYQPGYGSMDPYGSYPGYYDPYYSYPYWGYPPPYGFPMTRYPSPTGPAGAGSQHEKDEAACAAGPGSAPPATGVLGHPHHGRYPMMPPAFGPHSRPPPGPGIVSPVGPAPSGMPPLPPVSAGAASIHCSNASAASGAAYGAPKPPVPRGPGSGKAHAHCAAAKLTVSATQPPALQQQQQVPAPAAEDFARMVETFFLDGGDVDVADLDLQLDAADEAVIYGHVQGSAGAAAAAGETATGVVAGAAEHVAAAGTADAAQAAAAAMQPCHTVQQTKAEPGTDMSMRPLAPGAEAGGDATKPRVKSEPEAPSHAGDTFPHGPAGEDVDATVTLRVPLPSSAKANSMADSPFPFGCLESTGLTPLGGKAVPRVRAPTPGGKAAAAAAAQLLQAGMEAQPGSASALAAVMAMDEGTPLADLRSLAAELPSRGTSLQGFEMLDMPDLGGTGPLGDDMRDLDCAFFLTSPALGAGHTAY